MELKIGIGSVIAIIGLTGGAVATGWATFETKANAEERYELAASDREKGDLQTRLDLVKVKIKRLTDIAKVRELEAEEQIELESLQAERTILLERLSELG